MERKNIPVVLMLIAGVLISIITFIKNYELVEKLLILLITLLIFYGLGCLLVAAMNHFDKVNEQKRLEEEKAAEEARKAEEAKQEETNN